MGKKYTLLFITILCVGFSISASTYAYWTWTSNVNKNVNFKVVSGFEQYIIYDEGDSYFVGDFQPSVNYCDGLKNTISFKKTNNDVNFQASINMDVNAIENNIKNSDFVYWVVTSGDDTSCTGNLNDALAYGTFKNKANGSVIEMLNNVEVTTSEQKFTIWIWIDSSGSNLSNLSGQTLDTNIWTQFDMLDRDASGVYSDSILNGADPVLDSGMVPIVLSNTGVATVADKSQEWYNYGDKEWANAVLVKENATSGTTGSYSREYYLNNPGTTVLESDILAYYVWIPRYKYQIWTTNATQTTSPQQINIVFEDKDTTKSNGNIVGQYLTHPAFTFGDEELNGLWVGKFEPSVDSTTDCYTTGNCNNTNQEPKILPNVSSLRNQNVSNQFQTSLKFSGGTINTSNGVVTFEGSNTYGLTNQIDSHMMKNSEWGAVAYLSHSKYGINYEIRINNNDSYITGCGASEENAQLTSECQIAYGGVSDGTYPQSTTGNITGIFDMSGGAWEYVMGVLSDTNGNPRSGNSSYYNSGFNGTVYDSGNNTSYTSGIAFSNNKYYDLYLQSQFSGDNKNNMIFCTLETCGGHALNETAGWYNDYANFVNPGYPWFVRGGSFGNGINAGAFYSDFDNGGDYFSNSWRSVLVAVDGA